MKNKKTPIENFTFKSTEQITLKPTTNYPTYITTFTRNLSQFSSKNNKQISISDYIGAGEEFNIFELPDKKLSLTIKGKEDAENNIILPNNFTVGANKILKTAIVSFTKNNSVDNLARSQFNLDVIIPLKDYARLCDKDIDINPDAPDISKEKARVRNILSKFRGKLRDDLQLILSSNFTAEQKLRHKTVSATGFNFIGGYEVKKDYIYIELTKSFATFLLDVNVQSRFSKKLLAIDERNVNAFSLGETLIYHYSNYKFQRKGTHNRRIIKNLLELPELPTYDEIVAGGYSWTERIKAPFENALNELKRTNFLIDWYYTNENNEKITTFKDYERWQNSKLFFEISDKEEVLNPNKEEKKPPKNRKT